MSTRHFLIFMFVIFPLMLAGGVGGSILMIRMSGMEFRPDRPTTDPVFSSGDFVEMETGARGYIVGDRPHVEKYIAEDESYWVYRVGARKEKRTDQDSYWKESDLKLAVPLDDSGPPPAAVSYLRGFDDDGKPIFEDVEKEAKQ